MKDEIDDLDDDVGESLEGPALTDESTAAESARSPGKIRSSFAWLTASICWIEVLAATSLVGYGILVLAYVGIGKPGEGDVVNSSPWLVVGIVAFGLALVGAVLTANASFRRVRVRARDRSLWIAVPVYGVVVALVLTGMGSSFDADCQRAKLASGLYGSQLAAYSPTGPELAYLKQRYCWTELNFAREGRAGNEIIWRTPVGWSAGQLAWSPDARSIAVGMTGSSFESAVRLVDVSTSRSRLLPGGPRTVNGIAWSPDGQYLLLERISMIEVVNVGSGESRILKPPGWSTGGETWTPDSRVAVRGVVDGLDGHKVWAVIASRFDHEDWRPVGPVAYEGHSLYTRGFAFVSTSPEGSRVIVSGRIPGIGSAILISEEGAASRLIVEAPEPTFGNGVLAPAPRGDLIAFVSEMTGTASISTVKLSTGSLTTLMTDTADVSNLSWSSDGNQIAFVSSRYDREHWSRRSMTLNVVDVVTGSVEEVAVLRSGS